MLSFEVSMKKWRSKVFLKEKLEAWLTCWLSWAMQCAKPACTCKSRFFLFVTTHEKVWGYVFIWTQVKVDDLGYWMVYVDERNKWRPTLLALKGDAKITSALSFLYLTILWLPTTSLEVEYKILKENKQKKFKNAKKTYLSPLQLLVRTRLCVEACVKLRIWYLRIEIFDYTIFNFFLIVKKLWTSKYLIIQTSFNQYLWNHDKCISIVKIVQCLNVQYSICFRIVIKYMNFPALTGCPKNVP